MAPGEQLPQSQEDIAQLCKGIGAFLGEWQDLGKNDSRERSGTWRRGYHTFIFTEYETPKLPELTYQLSHQALVDEDGTGYGKLTLYFIGSDGALTHALPMNLPLRPLDGQDTQQAKDAAMFATKEGMTVPDGLDEFSLEHYLSEGLNDGVMPYIAGPQA